MVAVPNGAMSWGSTFPLGGTTRNPGRAVSKYGSVPSSESPIVTSGTKIPARGSAASSAAAAFASLRRQGGGIWGIPVPSKVRRVARRAALGRRQDRRPRQPRHSPHSLGAFKVLHVPRAVGNHAHHATGQRHGTKQVRGARKGHREVSGRVRDGGAQGRTCPVVRRQACGPVHRQLNWLRVPTPVSRILAPPQVLAVRPRNSRGA